MIDSGFSAGIVAGARNRLSGPIRPIAVPLWLGAERAGVELGAEALEAGLRRDGQAAGKLPTRLAPTVDIPVAAPVDAGGRLDRASLEFLPEVAAACEETAAAVAGAVCRGELALVLGGDHALSVGSIAGAALAAERVGVLWLDTHPDLNTPATSPSGHIHGMPLAAALGLGRPRLRPLIDVGRPGAKVRAEDICLLGVRDIDPGEHALIRERNIWTLTMPAWTEVGIGAGLEAALAHLTAQGADAVHVSFDLDVLDPTVMPGTGTRYAGGLTAGEAIEVLRRLHAWEGPIRSVDWVELNPRLDHSGRSTELAVALLATLLGA